MSMHDAYHTISRVNSEAIFLRYFLRLAEVQIHIMIVLHEYPIYIALIYTPH